MVRYMTTIDITIPKFMYPILKKIENHEMLTSKEELLWDRFDCDLDFSEDCQKMANYHTDPFDF